MTWPKRGHTRGERLLWTLNRRKTRPTDRPLVATRAEVLHLGVLRLLDHLVEATFLEVAVTPRRGIWPARRRLAIARQLREAIRDDFLHDSHDGVDQLWRRLNPEERTLD